MQVFDIIQYYEEDVKHREGLHDVTPTDRELMAEMRESGFLGKLDGHGVPRN